MTEKARPSSLTRVLVVGLGSIGKRHARLIADRDDLALMLCDTAAEHLAAAQQQLARPAILATDDYHHALSQRPDLVFISAPNHLHVPLGLAALEAGCDLLVEKPISDILADGVKLVELAHQAGRMLSVGYMLRFDMGLRKLRDLIRRGELGQPVAGRAMVGTYITLLNAVSPQRDQQPYSLVVDYTHEIDFMGWLLDRPFTAVQAMEARLGERELRPQPNIFQLNATLEGGALVQIHLDYVQYPQRRSVEIIGDKATVSYDLMTGEIRLYPLGRKLQWRNLDVPPIADRVDDLYRDQLESLLTAHRNHTPPKVTPDDALMALSVAEAAIQAAQSGSTVAVK